jgi:hypothetical protein
MYFVLRISDESSSPLLYGHRELLLDKEYAHGALDKSTIVEGLHSHLL